MFALHARPQRSRGKESLGAKMCRVAALLVFSVALTTNCANSSSNQKKDSQEDKPVETSANTGLAPASSPEETVKALYGDSTFLNLRNRIPAEVIAHLSPCLTAELKAHLEQHNKDVKAWMENPKNANLKLPVREGPIFVSNYEGANAFKVGEARVDGTKAEVPVSLSVNDVMGSFEWVDVAVLHQVGDVWLLDNIQFQPDNGDGYTLLKRVALEE